MIVASFINIVEIARPLNIKTQRWEVRAKKDAAILGRIQWRSGWRCYVFEPSFPTVFEEVCLREIADFIETETACYKTQQR